MDRLNLGKVLVGIEAMLTKQVAFTEQAMEQQIEQLKQFYQTQALSAKEVLNSREAALVLDVSEDHLYRLTSQRKVKFFKPEGKKIYFLQDDLREFMLRNPHRTTEEIGREAAARGKKGGGAC